jgi:hypothetical protein
MFEIGTMKELSRGQKEDDCIKLQCHSPWGAFNVKIKRSDKVSTIKDKVYEKTGVCIDNSNTRFNFRLYRRTFPPFVEVTLLKDDMTIEESGFHNGRDARVCIKLV